MTGNPQDAKTRHAWRRRVAPRRGRAAGLEYDYSRGGDEWDEMGALSERAPSLSCEYICMNPLLSSLAKVEETRKTKFKEGFQ